MFRSFLSSAVHSSCFNIPLFFMDVPSLSEIIRNTTEQGYMPINSAHGGIKVLAWTHWKRIVIWVNIDTLPYDFSDSWRATMSDAYQDYLYDARGKHSPGFGGAIHWHIGKSTLKVEVAREAALDYWISLYRHLQEERTYQKVENPLH